MTGARIVLLMLACVGLSGCSPLLVQKASDADDSRAKQFSADAARAIIYVYRDDTFLGGDVTSNIYVGEKPVAEGARNRFNVLSLPPGHYTFSSASNEAGALQALLHNRDKPLVDLTVEAGKLYFVHEKWEGISGFFLHSATREEAEPSIMKGRLTASREL